MCLCSDVSVNSRGALMLTHGCAQMFEDTDINVIGSENNWCCKGSTLMNWKAAQFCKRVQVNWSHDSHLLLECKRGVWNDPEHVFLPGSSSTPPQGSSTLSRGRLWTQRWSRSIIFTWRRKTVRGNTAWPRSLSQFWIRTIIVQSFRRTSWRRPWSSELQWR